ncbi:hypothetical protein ARMGADRAFT_1040131 [Armillaria gallica]|uniref:CxC2-like cysteine cluster KDZ transposase-associated domain-containing protein n=1 Tax=Armillaria gallica TaxID=47427 RepID=A0A2H3CYH8_ARMGA|nr:hypothetical protein ARMGADRAFT_1040131 [Armillaria gallica]
MSLIFARNLAIGKGKTKRHVTAMVTKAPAAICQTFIYSQGDWVSAWGLANNNPNWESWVCNLKASVVHTKQFNKLVWLHLVINIWLRLTGDVGQSSIVLIQASRRGRLSSRGAPGIPVFGESWRLCKDVEPCHIIQHWSGTHFKKVPLRELGLHVQLGHSSHRCINPQPVPDNFTVIHSNGIHCVAVNFCWCKHRASPRQQLLCMELFPVTVESPKTCATFCVMEQFQVLSSSGKILAYKFHQALVVMTDCMGILKVKMLKMAGHGNEKDGITTTPPGSLALKYPACLRPGINLPPDWDTAPPKFQFLYMLILALDANFRLKNLYQSNWQRDPGLHTGLAYFVEPVKYLEHVTWFASQKDISMCSGFQMLAHAESRNVTGLHATGVGMCVCARHEIIRPLAVGDLQKGEWYCNMDYIALSAVQGHGIKSLFWSYNIACQWKLNLFERMAELLMNIQIIDHTDREGIEQAWAEINVVANSTKEMGPGNRYDKLDRQFAKHNWKKLVELETEDS